MSFSRHPGPAGGAPARRLTPREWTAAALPVLLLLATLTMLGANGTFLMALAAMGEIALALALLLLVPPELGFWRRILPVLVPASAAILWTALPESVVLTRLVPPLAGPHGARLAPELFPAALAEMLGFVACLVAGTLIGARRGLPRVMVDLLIGGGLLWLAISLVLFRADPSRVWGVAKGFQQERFSATLLSPNPAGAMIGAFTLLAVGRTLDVLRRIGRVPVGALARRVAPFALAATLALAGLALTQSRVAMLATLAAIALMLLFEVLRRTRSVRAIPLVLAAALALPALGLLLLLGGPVAARFGSLGQDGSERLEAIRRFGALSLEAPWFGRGAGAFSRLNLTTLTATTADTMWNLNAAHCAPVQAALEAGWPFTLLVVVAVAIWARLVVPALRAPDAQPLMDALVLVPLLLVAAGLVDIALNVPAIAAFAIMIGAIALGRANRRPSEVAATRPARPAAAARS